MSGRHAAAWIAGGGLLAAWLAAARVPAPARPAAPDPAPAAAHDFSAREQVPRVPEFRSRLEGMPLPTPSSRDPFRFAAKRPAAPAGQPVAATAAPAPPVGPVLRLTGIAADETVAGAVRTAIISDGDQLFLVKEGEPVTGCCRVGRIGADEVEVRDEKTGATIRLRFR